MPFSAFSQDVENEQVKRLQRSIYIYNFAQQVGGWPNFEKLETFKIGVLGADRSIIDLKSLAQKRKIQNKSVEVISFSSIKSVKDIQVLYVNNKFNYDIQYILDKVESKSILLVTEDYNYNSSMINMISVGNTFEYEINLELLTKEGFQVASSLKKYAVSSSQKWKDLYKSTEESLNSAKKTEAKQEQLLRDKEQQILSQTELITSQKKAIDTTLKTILEKDDWIEQLGTESELQQRKYEEKLLIEERLEKSIGWQIAIVKAQKEKIASSDRAIQKQLKFLARKTNEIQVKDKILKEKNSEIDAHKRANFLLITLMILAILGVLFVYRSYLIKKKLNKALDEKNNAIQKQSLLLASKNIKLEQFNYIATHDLKVPISNLEGYYTFLKEDLKTDNAELLDTVHWMGKSIDQSKLMISDLIQIIESETRQEDSELIYFEVLAHEILESLNQEIAKRKAQVDLNFEGCTRINYGKVELKSIIQNLIGNALKYQSPERSPIINVQTTTKGGYVVLSISDNGMGINLESYSKDLFAPFKRIHTKEEGSGIGLYMIKNTVESSGGKIEVKSELGEGTEFIVYLKQN